MCAAAFCDWLSTIASGSIAQFLSSRQPPAVTSASPALLLDNPPCRPPLPCIRTSPVVHNHHVYKPLTGSGSRLSSISVWSSRRQRWSSVSAVLEKLAPPRRSWVQLLQFEPNSNQSTTKCLSISCVPLGPRIRRYQPRGHRVFRLYTDAS